MRLALPLAAASAGLFALGAVAVVQGGLCCPPAGFVAHLAPTAVMAAALDRDGSAGRVGEDH
ncbi:hypothetical protein ACFQY5_33170 [Paeniroseomonas aquatica]|uniref:Uncharacterized protein n=1 Tax=Paeniroseomonas aquatica TaxID=373043 RepID=A0ABT8A2X5_9PROT|nr:hypothetical protein [Paeniroseomonas aquatica]MDN3564099.1 hypothetical protein [Paeniroseomonas aquatica]